MIFLFAAVLSPCSAQSTIHVFLLFSAFLFLTLTNFFNLRLNEPLLNAFSFFQIYNYNCLLSSQFAVCSPLRCSSVVLCTVALFSSSLLVLLSLFSSLLLCECCDCCECCELCELCAASFTTLL